MGEPHYPSLAGGLRLSTFIHAGEMQALFRGFSTARSLKSLLEGLLVGNENLEVKTRIWGDN